MDVSRAALPIRAPRASEVLAVADELLAVLILALVIVGAFRRLSYGVDFADESFYAAITQRYALGDRPFIDELNLRQTAGLLPMPLYWAFLKINGSTDGAVYFLRVLFFGLQAGLAATVYRFARVRLPRAFALVAAALPFAFIPFCIPTCSYNTLGSMLLAAGTFVALGGMLDDSRPRIMTAAGVLHGLACIAYPPLALPVALFGAITRLVPQADGRSRPWRPTLAYALGVGAVAILFSPLILPGLPGAKHALTYESMTTSVRTFAKFKAVGQAIVRLSPGGPGTLTTLAVAGLLAKESPRLRQCVFAGMIIWLAYWFSEVQPEVRPEAGTAYLTYLLPLYLTVYLGLLAAFFVIFLDWRSTAKVFLFAGWVPSMAAGLITGTASDNTGCLNAGIGLFTAGLLTMIVAPMAVPAMGPMTRAVGVAVMACVPLSMLSVSYAATYGDVPPDQATAVVRTGPYRGLHGSPSKAAQAEELTSDLRALVQPGQRMLSYYDFPAAYLSVPSRPALQTVWTDHRAKLGWLLPYYQAHRTGGSVVLVVAGRSGTSPELESLVERPERLLRDRGWFRIYREPPP